MLHLPTLASSRVLAGTFDPLLSPYSSQLFVATNVWLKCVKILLVTFRYLEFEHKLGSVIHRSINKKQEHIIQLFVYIKEAGMDVWH